MIRIWNWIFEGSNPRARSLLIVVGVTGIVVPIDALATRTGDVTISALMFIGGIIILAYVIRSAYSSSPNNENRAIDDDHTA